MNGVTGNKMTISAAIDAYKLHGREIYGKALHEALMRYSECASNDPLDNDSYVDALFLTEIMFSKTDKSMEILTGKDSNKFLSVLKDSLVAALKRIKTAGGTARFILVDSPDVPEVLTTLKTEGYPIETQLAKTVAGAQVRHMIVCDNDMLRDEEYHAELNEETPADAIKAKIYLNSPIHAKVKKSYFDSTWKQLSER